MPANQVRIIGGRHRGRRLHFSPGRGLRPTPDRVRETLFNWLQAEIRGARCLDLFAGSGALGLEALSRGAACLYAVEQNRAAAQRLRDNVALLHEESAVEVLQVDALRLLKTPPDAGPACRLPGRCIARARWGSLRIDCCGAASQARIAVVRDNKKVDAWPLSNGGPDLT